MKDRTRTPEDQPGYRKCADCGVLLYASWLDPHCSDCGKRSGDGPTQCMITRDVPRYEHAFVVGVRCTRDAGHPDPGTCCYFEHPEARAREALGRRSEAAQPVVNGAAAFLRHPPSDDPLTEDQIAYGKLVAKRLEEEGGSFRVTPTPSVACEHDTITNDDKCADCRIQMVEGASGDHEPLGPGLDGLRAHVAGRIKAVKADRLEHRNTSAIDELEAVRDILATPTPGVNYVAEDGTPLALTTEAGPGLSSCDHRDDRCWALGAGNAWCPDCGSLRVGDRWHRVGATPKGRAE